MQTFETQRKEFDAMDALRLQYKRVCNTPIVDDDYPQVRFEYEQTLIAFIEAMKANGRFEQQGNRYGLIEGPEPEYHNGAPAWPVPPTAPGVTDAQAQRLRDALPLACAGYVSLSDCREAMNKALAP